MNKFNFEVVEETMEEITIGEPVSLMEKSLWHDNLVGVQGRDFFSFGHLPLEDGVRRENVVCHKVADLVLIDRSRLEHLGAQGGVTPGFKAKPNAHNMCAQESSLHTHRTENGYRMTNVSI
jgi:hypothetical protein